MQDLLEGWHRQFNDSMMIAHPTIRKFIKVVQKGAGVQQVRIAHFVGGPPSVEQKGVYKDLNDNRNISEYLRGIQYNLST